jgi:carboxylesterase type B
MVGQTAADIPDGPFGPAWRAARHLAIVRPAEDDGEDCLTLDIQRPASSIAGEPEGDGWPVLVWFFGGAFEIGGRFTPLPLCPPG